MQFQLRSVREVCKDLNIMSSSLSADRVKCEPELKAPMSKLVNAFADT